MALSAQGPREPNGISEREVKESEFGEPRDHLQLLHNNNMRQLRAAARLWTVTPRASTAGLPRVAAAQILGRTPRALASSMVLPRQTRGFVTSSPAAAAKSAKDKKDKEPSKKIDMTQFPPERIR